MNDSETLLFPEELEDRVMELERRSGALYMYQDGNTCQKEKER